MERGVLFDVDGTLLDTNYFHVIAWWRTFRASGTHVPTARIHRLIGMGGDQLTRTVCGQERTDLSQEQSRQMAAFSAETVAFDGAAELLRETRRQGLAVVLATSAKAEQVDGIRRALGADDAITALVTSADVAQTKPEPDIFGAGIRIAELDPSRTVVVGDSVWDVEAAHRAHLPCVCVTSGGYSRQELEESGPVAVYPGVRALLEEFGASPLGGLLR